MIRFSVFLILTLLPWQNSIAETDSIISKIQSGWNDIQTMSGEFSQLDANGNIDNGITFSNNCNYPSGCFSNSIEEYQSNLSVYPNPTTNLIQIKIENYNGSFEAELYDVTGKLLETTNKTVLSLANYSSGIYLLKLAYGDHIEALRLVKE